MRFPRYVPWLLLSLLAACSLPKLAPDQSGRFYTWMDAEGRLHTQTLPEVAAAHPAPALATPPAAQTAAPQPVVASGKATPGLVKAPEDRPDLFAPDADFVDSAVLESHHFNLENKKKFGIMTDTTGRSYPVYFAQGEGGSETEDMPVAAAPAGNIAAPLEHGDSSWPTVVALPEHCCGGLQDAAVPLDALRLRHAYRVSLPAPDCVVTGACKPIVFAMPKHGKERMMRLYSYMSSMRCKLCVQWPVVVILDRNYQPRRAYVADLGGFRAESWYGYASFHFDFDIADADDAYLMLIQSSRALSYKNKRYQGSDKGEIAFALIP